MEEYTIKEVASILDVSESTIRRKIKNGEIAAEKKEGPYGPTYFVPGEEINSKVAQNVVEVVKTNKTIDVKRLQEVVIKALEDRDDRLIDIIDDRARKREERLIEALEKQMKEIQELKEKVNSRNSGFLDRFKEFIRGGSGE